MTSAPILLAVGAHPDDLEIGCAGSLMRWGHRYRLIFAVATVGERARPHGVDRLVEAEKVAAGFGATLESLGLADGNLEADADLIATLEQLAARYRPARVLVPSRNDVHQDHRALGRAAVVAFKRVDEVLAYEAHSSDHFDPSYFVDISEYIDRKCDLVALHESQAAKIAVSPEYIRTTARYWCQKRCHEDGYVEAFEVVRYVDSDR